MSVLNSYDVEVILTVRVEASSAQQASDEAHVFAEKIKVAPNLVDVCIGDVFKRTDYY